MKKNSKVVAFLLALVMVFTLVGPGVKTYAATDAADYAGSTTQSTMKNVKMDGTKISGTFNLWGYATDLSVYEGNQLSSAPSPTANKVGNLTKNAGEWPIASDVSFDITVSDDGKSSKGYTIIVSGGTAWAGAYIPYAGPVYEVGIQKDGADVESLKLGLYDGEVSGFTFIHEAGQSFNYSVDNESVIGLNVSGDNFSITPKAAGTATITAVVAGVSEATLKVTVEDNSSVSAVWYETNKNITNNAVFNAEAGITYGFGVETVPAGDYDVTLSDNTAEAVYAKSEDPSQYPNTLKATKEGSVKVTIKAASKSLMFTVNFAKAEVYFDFYMDQACTEVAEPMVAVEAGKTVTIYTSLPVGSWDTSLVDGAQVVSQTKTSITIKAVTVDSLSTITALDEDGAELSFFDVYVTGEGEEEPETDLAVTLTADASSVSAGKLVKFTAKATGGAGDYTYKYVITSNAKEERIHAASTSTTCRYKMAKAGTKVVTVIVTDANGDVATASFTVTVR